MRIRWIIAGVIVAIGLVWIGQGSGVIPGSFMSGDPRWALIGAILVAVGLVVSWTALSRRPAP
jgi:multisubunit Na+/H+ antiporter MnhB subunit